MPDPTTDFPTNTPPTSVAPTNPPRDPRLRPLAMLGGYGPRTGFIEPATWSLADGGVKDPEIYTRLNFQYNPSNLRLTHSVDQSNSMIPPQFRSDSDPTAYIGFSGAGLSCTLLFDRTYELAFTRDYETNPAAVYGCYTDISILQTICGINDIWRPPVATAVPGAAANTATPPPGVATYTGIMTWRPVNLRVSDAHIPTGGFNPVYDYSTFYGVITNFDVDITHRTENMVPMRCAIAISMNLLVRYTKAA